MKKLIAILALFTCLSPLLVLGQAKQPSFAKMGDNYKRSPTDSLYTEFSNAVYFTYYNPVYMTNKNTTYAMLKVDIDWNGRVTNISFSDSADPAFLSAWTETEKKHSQKETLERWAKAKNYKDISLLIPVAYQPNYPNQLTNISYADLDSFMKFKHQQLSGNVLVCPAIKIVVYPEKNM